MVEILTHRKIVYFSHGKTEARFCTRSSHVDILLFLVHVVRIVDWYQEKGKDKEGDKEEEEEDE